MDCWKILKFCCTLYFIVLEIFLSLLQFWYVYSWQEADRKWNTFCPIPYLLGLAILHSPPSPSYACLILMFCFLFAQVARCWLYVLFPPLKEWSLYWFFFQDLASFCRMYCSFVIAHRCKEMCSANGFIPSLLNYVMQVLEGGAFGMWVPMVDR